MEAAICRVVVFGAASVAHCKARHSRRWPIVRNVLNDGVSRTAVCAVRKWISKPTIVGIAEISPAIGTSSHIGRDKYELADSCDAFANDKIFVSLAGEIDGNNFLNTRKRRWRAAKLIKEIL